MNKLGGRKFVGLIVVLAAGIYLEGHNPQGMSQTALMLLLGLYSGFALGNISEYFVNRKSGAEQPTLDLDSLKEHISSEIHALGATQGSSTSEDMVEVSNQLGAINESLAVVSKANDLQGQALHYIVDFVQKNRQDVPRR